MGKQSQLLGWMNPGTAVALGSRHVAEICCVYTAVYSSAIRCSVAEILSIAGTGPSHVFKFAQCTQRLEPVEGTSFSNNSLEKASTW